MGENLKRKVTGVKRGERIFSVVRYECPFCHQDALEIKVRPGSEVTFAGVSRNGNPTFTFNAEYIVVHRRDVECAFSGGIRSKPYNTENEAIEAITSWKEKRSGK